MTYYTVPMLIDIFRLTKESLPHTVLAVVDYLKKSGGSFNYNKAARYQRAAYNGYTDLEALHKQCLGMGDNPECVQNAKVFNLIGGLAKGRKIQTFDFPKRKLTLAKNIESSMGPSFFFVENETVNLFYLHCRSEFRASRQDLAMLAAACKLEILDLEFYGLPSDIEFIDVGPRDKHGAATVNKISLADLDLPSADEVKSKTDLFLEAFRMIDENHLAGEKVKPGRKPKEDRQPSLDL